LKRFIVESLQRFYYSDFSSLSEDCSAVSCVVASSLLASSATSVFDSSSFGSSLTSSFTSSFGSSGLVSSATGAVSHHSTFFFAI